MNEQKSVLAEILRESRKGQFKTARLFHEELTKKIKIDYAHYTRVEIGSRLPDPALLAAMGRILGLDVRKLMHLWVREQMPSDELRGYFDEYRRDELPTIHKDIESAYTFIESQAPSMMKIRSIWEVACFITHFQTHISVTPKVLEEALDLTKAEVKQAVQWLQEQSIAESRGGRLYSRRGYLHLPYKSEEFFGVRNFNFSNLSSKLLKKLKIQDLDEKRSTRFTVLQRLSKENALEMNQKLIALQNSLAAIPDEGTEFYTLCVASGSLASFKKEGK